MFALHHALARGNALPLIEALLDSGADPLLRAPRLGDASAVALAARAGRADALDLFERRGFRIEQKLDLPVANELQDRPALRIGESIPVRRGEQQVTAGAGGFIDEGVHRHRAIMARVILRSAFG